VQILEYPHPSLFTVCQEVAVFDSKLKDLLDEMWTTMIKANGLGLAANQVNYLINAFVMNGQNGERYNIINPKLVRRSIAYADTKEGCLSAPGEFVVVRDRSLWALVTYQDENGHPRGQVFHDIYAVVIQHEMDHLMGKSHLQSLSIPKKHRQALARKWKLP
jgi:peptide deformylase